MSGMQCRMHFSLHVSGNYMPINRRNNCIYATLGICHSVWMNVWYVGRNAPFSTCFGQLRAHHQKKQLYLYDTCYLSLCVDECLVCSVECTFLYMFRATMCPSSGETTVSMRHLVFVTLCGWMSAMQGGMPRIPRGRAVDWGTALHVERSRVLFPIV